MTLWHVPETLKALEPQTPRQQRKNVAWLRIRLVGTFVVLGLAFSAGLTGLYQQQLGLPASSIDCNYRARILSERLSSLMTRSVYATSPSNQRKAFTSFSNLLRETRAHCASLTPVLSKKLSSIETIFGEAQERWYLDSAAREVLRDI